MSLAGKLPRLPLKRFPKFLKKSSGENVKYDERKMKLRDFVEKLVPAIFIESSRSAPGGGG